MGRSKSVILYGVEPRHRGQVAFMLRTREMVRVIEVGTPKEYRETIAREQIFAVIVLRHLGVQHGAEPADFLDPVDPTLDTPVIQVAQRLGYQTDRCKATRTIAPYTAAGLLAAVHIALVRKRGPKKPAVSQQAEQLEEVAS